MTSGQKFVARNRAPRVQIEYDVELYGARKSVQLPFVMGVMADLAGKSATAQPAIADRRFLEIDVDNFDDRLKAIAPRAAFAAPNMLTGEGDLAVDLTFERLEDFSPAAVARKVAPLSRMLEARTQLSHLLTYMDGKAGAEALIARLLTDPEALSAILAGGRASEVGTDVETEATLNVLRAAAPARTEPAKAAAEDAFAALRAAAPGQAETRTDDHEAVLAALGAVAPTETAPRPDAVETALSALRKTKRRSAEAREGTEPALDALREAAPDGPMEDADLAALTGENEIVDETAEATAGADAKAQEGGAGGDSPSDLHDLDEMPEEAPEDAPALAADFDLDLDPEREADAAFDLGPEADGVCALGLDLEATEGEASDPDLAPALDPEADETLDLDLDAASDLADEAEGEDLTFDADLDPDLDPADAEAQPEPDPFGRLELERSDDLDAPREKFRIALLGDFSGRAGRGECQIGDALAARKPIRLDIDRLDDVIARFAAELVLPLGEGGEGVTVRLSALDDLHPDELFENVEIFEALADLRRRVARNDAAAIAKIRAWSETAVPSRPVRRRARGAAVPADRRLSDFQALIGDRSATLTLAGEAETLIARIVGPYVQAAPAPDAEYLLAAVDQALSGAMRALLHNPDFQAIESCWRSLELIARRAGGDGRVEIVLYDVSAEEWAADLAAQEDLSTSGLFRLLAEAPRLDETQGPLSAVFGLYALEETPPHAELLARMAKVSAWMNAPFVAALSARALETAPEDRHPLTAKAWEAMRALPDAAHIGLTGPRFLLRLPYGKRTEPVEPFEFEEFTLRDGLSGMLWANPAVLPAILMAETAARSGKQMRLGDLTSLGEMPVHTLIDAYGDQVALPCTERLLDSRAMAQAISRGLMPVASTKGRDVIRLTSFQALGAAQLAGPWAMAGLATGQGGVEIAMASGLASAPAGPAGKDAAAGGDGGEGDAEEGDMFGDLGGADDDPFADLGGEGGGDDPFGGMDLGDDDDAGGDLDDLLGGFGDDLPDPSDAADEGMDPDLAALLKDL